MFLSSPLFFPFVFLILPNAKSSSCSLSLFPSKRFPGEGDEAGVVVLQTREEEEEEEEEEG